MGWGIANGRVRRVGLGVVVALVAAELATGWSPVTTAASASPVVAAVPESGKAITGEPPAAGFSTAKGSTLIEGRAPIKVNTPTDTTPYVSPPVTPVNPGTPAPPATPGKKLTGFDPATSVEVKDKRTATTTTYLNTDGTFTDLVSSVPVHYRVNNGPWLDIDNTVRPNRQGILETAGNDWTASFEAMTPSGGVTLKTGEGNFRFLAENAAPVAPAVEADGTTVRYADLYPDTDLVYKIQADGIEELLVIKSSAGRAEVSFIVYGAQFDKGTDGLHGRGHQLRVTNPETFDGKGRAVDVTNHVFDTADVDGGRSRLRLGLDRSFVDGLTADQFPIVVDPNISVGLSPDVVQAYAVHGATGATYASYADGYARVGNPYLTGWNSTVRWRSVVRFDTSPYFGASIYDALLVTTVASGSGSGPTSSTAGRPRTRSAISSRLSMLTESNTTGSGVSWWGRDVRRGRISGFPLSSGFTTSNGNTTDRTSAGPVLLRNETAGGALL